MAGLMDLSLALRQRDRCKACGGELLEISTLGDPETVRTFVCEVCGEQDIRYWNAVTEGWESVRTVASTPDDHQCH